MLLPIKLVEMNGRQLHKLIPIINHAQIYKQMLLPIELVEMNGRKKQRNGNNVAVKDTSSGK